MACKNDSAGATSISIDKSKVLGAGSYGVVYVAHWNELTCAAKAIHGTLFVFNVSGRPNIAQQFEKECEVISKFRHPNIVQFLGMILDPDTLFPVLLMELMERNLTVLLEESKEPLPYGMQISICHDVALAVTYLHTKRFIHRDISSNNVLMKGSIAKITDLGVSVLIDSDVSSRHTKCPGTEVYMPPDSVGDTPEYTEKIDCFSFGVLGVQILTRLFPKPAPRHCRVVLAAGLTPNINEILERVVPEIERRREHIDMIPTTHPLLELLRKCLKDREADRPSAVEICRYVAHLVKIEENEEKLRIQASGFSKVEEMSDLHMKHLRMTSNLQECQLRIAALESENENKSDRITHLEQEKAELAQQPPRTVRNQQVCISRLYVQHVIIIGV